MINLTEDTPTDLARQQENKSTLYSTVANIRSYGLGQLDGRHAIGRRLPIVTLDGLSQRSLGLLHRIVGLREEQEGVIEKTDGIKKGQTTINTRQAIKSDRRQGGRRTWGDDEGWQRAAHKEILG